MTRRIQATIILIHVMPFMQYIIHNHHKTQPLIAD